MTKRNDFKTTASSIFKDVLGDKTEQDAPLHKNADAQVHKAGIVEVQNIEPMQSDTVLSRLHVFIRRELEDKLLDEVIRRKKDRSVTQKLANKRAVVEQALEQFL